MRTKRTYHSKAFTVQELLVGMVVSSLIIGMMYTIYAQINKQLYVYNTQQEQLMCFNRFRQVLTKDIALAKSIKKQSNTEFDLEFADKTFTYYVSSSGIIRDRQHVKDTFAIEISKMELTNSIFENVGNQYIRIQTSVMDEEIVLFEHKPESVATRMNRLFLDEY